MFEEEFETLIEVKRSIIKKAVEGGVAKSSTLQVQTQRVDAKIEEAILQVQHLGHTFAHFIKAEADAVSAATAETTPGGSATFAEAQAAAEAAAGVKGNG
jgi:hypothetical protein